MATTKVSALPSKGTLGGSEEILINDGGTSKKSTVTAVRTGSYTLPEATSTVRGGVELFSDTDQSVAATAVSTTASRTYGLQLNSDGQGVVNVPWADTDTTYSAATASALGLVKIEDDAEQTVAANTVSTTASRTYGIQLNSGDQAVVNVPWTDTAYTLPEATTTVRGGLELFSDTDQSVAATAVSTTASRTYGLQLNSDGQGVMNVPWVDTNTTYSAATSSALGLVKLEDDTEQSVAATAVSATAARTYGIQLNSSDQAVVNVPWTDTDTTYSAATSSALGLIKLEDNATQTTAASAITTTAARTYGLQINASGQGVVNVPWTDTTASSNVTAMGLWEHAHTISANYSITSGNNAITAGPITIDTGYSVTVPTGSTWVVA